MLNYEKFHNPFQMLFKEPKYLAISKEEKKKNRKVGLVVFLATTSIGVFIDIAIYVTIGFHPAMMIILFFFMGIGSFSLITGHKLPEDGM